MPKKIYYFIIQTCDIAPRACNQGNHEKFVENGI